LRSIKEIENGLILPKETIFYSKPLPHSSVNPSEREEERKNWFKESLSQLKSADIIFLDPDNGIQTDKVRKTQTKAIKYVFKNEIKLYYELDKSFSKLKAKMGQIGHAVKEYSERMIFLSSWILRIKA
jgi:hypothetical protein